MMVVLMLYCWCNERITFYCAITAGGIGNEMKRSAVCKKLQQRENSSLGIYILYIVCTALIKD